MQADIDFFTPLPGVVHRLESGMLSAPLAVLRLALPLPLPQLFDYLPPAGAELDPGWIGCRVRVPFGRRSLVGIVAEIGAAEADIGALRRVEARLDAANLFGAELWRTLLWASAYYCRGLGDVLSTALPGPLRLGQAPAEDEEPVWALTAAGQGGLQRLRPGARPARIAHALATGGELDESRLGALDEDWRGAVRSLVQRGWVERRMRARVAQARPGATPPELNPAQQDAVDAVVAALGSFQPLLLDGVTGSGKTEVYLRAIEATLARGRQALVLVPEIGLTPQALRRYGERLAVPVYALHSGLNDGERARAWQAMASGRGRVLIGTRSAVFTPLPEAGLIIVDEEHDTSYKQQDGFR